jgi:Mlc titration factor MtfA (ptsG expression regulator)
LGADYAELVQAAEEGRPSFLDQYGATNPAEFFAVATEAFFETPIKLRSSHPQLYAELKLYYQQDPAG